MIPSPKPAAPAPGSDLPRPAHPSSSSTALAHGAKRTQPKSTTPSSSGAPADGGIKRFKPNALAAGSHSRREPLPRPWLIGLNEYFLGGNSDDDGEGDTARFAACMLRGGRQPCPSDDVTSEDKVVEPRFAPVSDAPASAPLVGNVAAASNDSSTDNVDRFRSLAETPGRPLQIMPGRSMPVPSNCVAYGENLRRDTGPIPSFLSLPSRPPSARFSTFCWRANLFEDDHTSFSTVAINSHVLRAALSELHFERVDAAAEADEDYDDDDEKQCDVGSSVSTIMSASLESLAAPPERRFLDHAVVTVKNGRPTWEAESRRPVKAPVFRLGFGCRPGNAPGPLPSLRLPPRKMAWCWHRSVDQAQRGELAAAAAAEREMWKGLLGLVNAAQGEEELARVRAYFKGIDDSYLYTVSKAPAAIHHAWEGKRFIRVPVRACSQRLWGRRNHKKEGRDARRTLGLTYWALPRLNVVECLEEYRRFYNHGVSWFGILDDHGLLIATKIIVEEHHWRVQHQLPADIDSVLDAIDERIDSGDIGGGICSSSSGWMAAARDPTSSRRRPLRGAASPVLSAAACLGLTSVATLPASHTDYTTPSSHHLGCHCIE